VLLHDIRCLLIFLLSTNFSSFSRFSVRFESVGCIGDATNQSSYVPVS